MKYVSLFLILASSIASGSVLAEMNMYQRMCTTIASLPPEDQENIKDIMIDGLETLEASEQMACEMCKIVGKRSCKKGQDSCMCVRDPHALVELMGTERGLWDRVQGVWEKLSDHARYLLSSMRDLIFGSRYDDQILTTEECQMPEIKRWSLKMDRCCAMLQETLDHSCC